MSRRSLTLAAFCLWMVACGVTPPGSVPHNGACFDTTDCLAPFQCLDGTCQLAAASACRPAAQRCNGKTLEACASTGDGWETVELCALGCIGGATPACLQAPCVAGQRSCDDGNLMACLPDGSGWTVLQACPTGCDDDETIAACAQAACVPFATRCRADGAPVLQTCNSSGTDWVDSTCEGLAASDTQAEVPGACAAGRCQLAVCAAGTERCFGVLAQQCLADGTGWQTREQCALGCVEEGDTAVCPDALCAPHAMRCLDATTREVCNSRGTAWTQAPCAADGSERCDDGQCRPRLCAVTRDDRGFVVHRDTRCEGRELQSCSDTEVTFESVETCAYGCEGDPGEASCSPPACQEGERRCDGHHLLRCAPDRSTLGLVTYCAVGCLENDGASPPDASCEAGSCPPLRRVCDVEFGKDVHFVSLCRADGAAYERLETCTAGCQNGRCLVTADTCTPGDLRCRGDEVEICVAVDDSTRWHFSERCLGGCSPQGTCDPGGTCGCADGDDSIECGEPGRAPFAVHALLPLSDDPLTPGDDTQVPCDPRSSVLVYTDVIRGRLGNVVPDGTLVTFTHDGDGELFASTDASAAQAGLQRPTLHGRALVKVRAPASCATGRSLHVTASIGGRCLGGGVVPFVTPAPTQGVPSPSRLVFVAEDFSTTDEIDPGSTATLDTAIGAALAPGEFDAGTGADGDLLLGATETFNLASSGRARFWEVLALGTNDATVNAHTPNLTAGDEVLLTTLWGSSTSYPGQFEFKRVASVAAGRVVFTQPIERQYAPQGVEIPSTYRVVLQRVPHFRNVTVPAGAKLTTQAMTQVGGRNAGGTGLIAFRATGDVMVLGRIDAGGLGYASGTLYPNVPMGTPAINKLLVGTHATSANAGAIYLHARRVTFRQDDTFAPTSARITASSAGRSGTVWVAAGELVFGAGTTRVFADGGASGLVRLDWGRLDNTTTASLPAAYFGQRGALSLQSKRVFEETTEQVPQLNLSRLRVVGAVAGTSDTQVAHLDDALTTTFPSLSLSASANDGGTWLSLDHGPAPVGAGRQFKWKASLVADEPGTLRLRGVAFQLNLQ